MITKPTVFVLGAGASAVFGFPTGQGLCQLVINQLAGNQQRKSFLNVTEFAPKDLDVFRQELHRSGQGSVDLFLEYRPEFLEIGKAAMASLLTTYEQSDLLWNFQGDNWLRYLFNQLRSTFEEFPRNRVSFITYNYDRSLEHFLFASLRSTYGRPVNECVEIFKSIPVIHLHGRLGYLPWEEKAGHADGREYTPGPLDVHAMNICRKHIKVVHEDIDEGRDKDFELAKQLLQAAERIYFVGFGYGKLNVDRLKVRNFANSKAWGTAYGLTESECRQIRSSCDAKISLFNNYDCISFFRNEVVWN